MCAKKIVNPTVAIVGATGAVGVELLHCLEQRKFPLKELKLFASARSAGKTMKFRGKDLRVEELTEGQIRMGPGTLYGSFQRMLDAELIEERRTRPASDDGERRRYYRITSFGRRVLGLVLNGARVDEGYYGY